MHQHPEDRLRKVRRQPKEEPVIRFETDPECRADGLESLHHQVLKNGETAGAMLLYILASPAPVHRLHPEARLLHLIRRHQDAFSHFQGTPAQCLYDSEKTVVLRWEAGVPHEPGLLRLPHHYRIRPSSASAGGLKRREDRAPISVRGRNLLCGREFQDLEDLRSCARWWLKEKSDLHLHETTGRAPVELFLEQELAALQPLPLHPYDCAEVGLRCVIWTDISTLKLTAIRPYEYVADILTMKVTEHEVHVYSPELYLIVRHERVPNGSRVTLDGSAVHG